MTNLDEECFHHPTSPEKEVDIKHSAMRVVFLSLGDVCDSTDVRVRHAFPHIALYHNLPVVEQMGHAITSSIQRLQSCTRGCTPSCHRSLLLAAVCRSYVFLIDQSLHVRSTNFV